MAEQPNLYVIHAKLSIKTIMQENRRIAPEYHANTTSMALVASVGLFMAVFPSFTELSLGEKAQFTLTGLLAIATAGMLVSADHRVRNRPRGTGWATAALNALYQDVMGVGQQPAPQPQ